MRRSNTKTILTACEMSFAGNTDTEIAVRFRNVCLGGISVAEECRFGIEFEQELISVHKESLLESHRLATLEESTP